MTSLGNIVYDQLSRERLGTLHSDECPMDVSSLVLFCGIPRYFLGIAIQNQLESFYPKMWAPERSKCLAAIANI